jgi:hypothetical protein
MLPIINTGNSALYWLMEKPLKHHKTTINQPAQKHWLITIKDFLQSIYQNNEN